MPAWQVTSIMAGQGTNTADMASLFLINNAKKNANNTFEIDWVFLAGNSKDTNNRNH